MDVEIRESRRYYLFPLIIIAIGLVTYTVYRAAHLSITHDEALTYQIVNGNGWSLEQTANHHPLNSALMKTSAKIFGFGEFALRLPNVLAHVIYLFGAILIAMRFRTATAGITAFALLAFNPFVNDFFGLARGYGLALAFLVLALYCMMQAWEETDITRKRGLAFIVLSLTFATLADWANYTMLIVHFGLFVAAAIKLLSTDTGIRFSNRRLMIAAGMIVVQVALWIPLFKDLIRLKAQGELYYGGTKGIIADTAVSLVKTSLYQYDHNVSMLHLAGGWTLASIVVLSAIILIRKRKSAQHARVGYIALIVLTILIAVVYVQWWLADGLFPRDRTALALIPLAALLFAGALDVLPMKRITQTAVLVFVFAVTIVWTSSFNTTHTASWKYDADTRDVMELVQTGETTMIAASWQLIPAMEYYREQMGMDSLFRIERLENVTEGTQLLYVLPEDRATISSGNWTVQRSNVVSGTQVWFRREQ